MRFLLLALPLLSISCFLSEAQVNRPLNLELVDQIKPHETTAQEVADLLGAPNQVVQLTERSAWLYEHIHTKQTALFLLVISVRGIDTQTDRVWVFFDENDVVTQIGSALNACASDSASIKVFIPCHIKTHLFAFCERLNRKRKKNNSN